jgi:hypothetical protein
MTASRIVDRALAEAGLDRWLARKLAGDVLEGDRAWIEERIPTLDPLVLGALADRVRLAELGSTVRVHLRRPLDAAAELPRFDPVAGGIAFLRAVARARLLGAAGAKIRIDVDDVGLQLSQVCLAYGASELIAPQKKRSIVTDADGDAAAEAILRERELAALVRAAGREPLIVETKGGEQRERAVDEHSSVKKKFRAPGRERDVSSEGDPS